MKRLFIGVLAMASLGAAQTPSASQPGGQVIFSRSMDENGQTTQSGSAQLANQIATAPSVENADRKAVTFTDFDMDVRLRTAEQKIAVRALVTVRNDGKTPLRRIPLQLSSSLNWERIRLNDLEGRSSAALGQAVSFSVSTLNSDVDHTGQLHEAVVPLTQPLASGASLQLDLTYSGQIPASAQRLLALGTPQPLALHSDWDQIGVDFTGLRGFGNVVWYPVSSVPAILGDGARLFDEIGEDKLRLTGARFSLRLTVEFPHGRVPTVALVNGQPVHLTVTESNGLDQSLEVSSVATANSGRSTLGFMTPSLFVAIRTPHPGANLTAYALPADEVSVQSWTAASAEVTPWLEGWLGKLPHSQLTLLDLPDPQDAPFESGSLLATPLSDAPADRLDGILVHALTRAWILLPTSPQPSPAWLDEGVAQFMGALWVEKQHGRDQALGTLETGRAALALAEPESPGQSAGQPLSAAISPVYYRTKAAYILWMLRDLVDDPALAAALRSYSAVAASTPASSKDADRPAARRAFEKMLEEAGARRDLSSFFADWVDTDKGLPEFTIESVFPSAETTGSWLVAVNVSNSGYVAAEVPVTVRSDTNSVTRRVLIPARGHVTERILVQGRPVEAQVNDGSIPETQASIHITRLEQPAEGFSSQSHSSPQ